MSSGEDERAKCLRGVAWMCEEQATALVQGGELDGGTRVPSWLSLALGLWSLWSALCSLLWSALLWSARCASSLSGREGLSRWWPTPKFLILAVHMNVWTL